MRRSDLASDVTRLVVPSTNGPRVGHCPDCGFLLTQRELLIEYDEATDTQRLYAECRFCETTLRFR